MAGDQESAHITPVNQVGLSPKPEDPRINLVRQIANVDCSSVPFSKLEVKVRDDGRPYSVIITRTYMIDPEGNVT